MTQVALSIFNAVITEIKGCPFCEEEKGKDETIDLSEDPCTDNNDPNYSHANVSGKLGKSLEDSGDKEPNIEIDAPKVYNDAAKADLYTYEIAEKYFRSDDEKNPNSIYSDITAVCCNPHHLIPGDASLAKCKKLLVYFAKTVKMKKVIYYRKGPAPNLHVVRAQKKKDEDGRTKVTVVRGKASTGTPKDTVRKTISGKVKGKINYDVNHYKNGVWLPAHSAVYKWGLLKSKDSKFPEEYAYRAIKKSSRSSRKKRQFHDSHGDYSVKVLGILARLSKEVKNREKKCLYGECDGPNKGKKEAPLPAPQKLVGALDKISGELEKLLVGKPSNWAHPWITSKLSISEKVKNEFK